MHCWLPWGPWGSPLRCISPRGPDWTAVSLQLAEHTLKPGRGLRSEALPTPAPGACPDYTTCALGYLDVVQTHGFGLGGVGEEKTSPRAHFIKLYKPEERDWNRATGTY